ncbi:hypothetical protein POSPLADRAFT_1139909 [Postia placenta MAD-698-R-SB12]|uniref:DEAD/DEAH box helicase domain-containing protein n=1 Tax=Postia placenta MAD-698-R-SB12 TaxID=670580 RepID=A0A1X6N584_9APHY|nr:hypothetical protein POSPLADRAFT_1139909 [Postia placenta MAD-698-R-SB12]OSX63622.1 hypothetical protein POSPLADRAFT_1139909 [Postia placenta MAD-698-R-SB12]
MAPAISTLAEFSYGLSTLSVSILKKACEEAAKTHQYSSAETRRRIIDEFTRVFDGRQPYDWQIDVTEAILLCSRHCVDCMVIAGTGAGKTMPFVMPLLLDETKKKMHFKKLGITAMAVNGDVYNTKLYKELEDHKHCTILTLPEMCLQHPQFSRLLCTPDFMKNISAIAHSDTERMQCIECFCRCPAALQIDCDQFLAETIAVRTREHEHCNGV